MPLLSKASTYAFLASAYLTKKESEEYISLIEIANEIGVSFNYLTKVCQSLTSANLMYSNKGPRGGIKLLKKSEEILLSEIISAVEGNELVEECIMNFPICNSDISCPLHNEWTLSRDSIISKLKSTTLEQATRDNKLYSFIVAQKS